ncbi:MAG: hypothetical protein AAF862_13175 [Pseudomonadota bacterium]
MLGYSGDDVQNALALARINVCLIPRTPLNSPQGNNVFPIRNSKDRHPLHHTSRENTAALAL